MSSILDALKKSERQRSLGRDLIFRNASPDAEPRLSGFAVAALAALVLLAVALGALLFSLREPELASPADTSRDAAAVSTASVASAGTGTGATDSASAPAPRTEMAPAPESQARTHVQTTPLPEKPAPEVALAAVDAPRAAMQPRAVPGTGEVPWLGSLPQAFRSSLPLLAVNIHVYSPDPSQRILYINNRPVQRGARIEGGVVVEEIVHDGVVLQYRGQRFKLPRPS